MNFSIHLQAIEINSTPRPKDARKYEAKPLAPLGLGVRISFEGVYGE
ncbi:MAG: hypothetical protein ACKVH8_03810 [Pirellulales bacterium]